MTAHEKFAAYAAIHRLSVSDQAEIYTTGESMIRKLLGRERRPGLDLAARIEIATKGYIRAIDWARPMAAESEAA